MSEIQEANTNSSSNATTNNVSPSPVSRANNSASQDRRRARDQRRQALRSKKSDGNTGGNRRQGSKSQKRNEEDSDLDSRVIEVRRVTRVVKGGKRMRFSALVVAGDKSGKIGIGLKKGLDYQDAVNKAFRKAKNSLITIDLNEDGSLKYPLNFKHKSCEIFIKPAKSGTGIIAGGFLRPVLELAGIRNIYSKINRSRNKVAGTQASFMALKNYKLEYVPQPANQAVETTKK